MLKGVAQVRLKEIIQEVSNEGRSEIDEMKIRPDHVHLLVKVDPQFGIAKRVTAIKGWPRFKGSHRPLHSIEGKSNVVSICWDTATASVSVSVSVSVSWGKGFVLPVIVPGKSKDPFLHAPLLSDSKYCRLVWRVKKRRQTLVCAMGPKRQCTGQVRVSFQSSKHARDVVAAMREPGYPANACLQTPRIYPRGWFRRER